MVLTLRTGDIVVLDNLGSHKRKAVRALTRATGAKLLFVFARSEPDRSKCTNRYPSSRYRSRTSSINPTATTLP